MGVMYIEVNDEARRQELPRRERRQRHYITGRNGQSTCTLSQLSTDSCGFVVVVVIEFVIGFFVLFCFVFKVC